jgi:hypothetical protein
VAASWYLQRSDLQSLTCSVCSEAPAAWRWSGGGTLAAHAAALWRRLCLPRLELRGGDSCTDEREYQRTCMTLMTCEYTVVASGENVRPFCERHTPGRCICVVICYLSLPQHMSRGMSSFFLSTAGLPARVQIPVPRSATSRLLYALLGRCVWGFWCFPPFELHVCSSTGRPKLKARMA